MASPQGSVVFYVTAYAASTLIGVGNLVMPVVGTDGWVVATAAARGATGRTSGVAMSVTNGSGFGTVEIWMGGRIDASITGIAAGAAERWVRTSATGTFEVFTPVNAGLSDIVGKAAADGSVTLALGVWTETMAAGGGGSGIPAPSSPATGDLLIYSSGAWSRLPIGANGQLLQVVSGLPAWVTSSTFDPSSLNLQAYLKGYAGSPWAGATSAGNSSTNPASNATPPSTGATLNGNTLATFNGTTQMLAMNGNLASYATGTSFWFCALVNASSAVADPGVNLRNTATPIVSDSNGYFSLTMTTTGPCISANDGSYHDAKAASSPIGNWMLVTAWRDATNLYVQANNGSPVSIPCGTVTTLSGAMTIGYRPYSPGFFTGAIAEVLASQSNLSASNTNVYASIKAKYPGAGLP